MAASTAKTIQPLPDHVVAQIKSSTAIVSLTHVIIDLLKNSLDAGATKIEATVDWARGGCSVEDNGLGIEHSEFREGGGLGRPYWTSKYSAHGEDSCFGRNGIFLASLAAMSLLTITSHQHEHRSHNSMTLHHSKVIDRQLPVPSQHEIGYAEHGTRVTVRNLFGNLPVRVKQRAVTAEHKAEHDKLWDILKRNLTALFLSWRETVSLRIRDAENRVVFQTGGLIDSIERKEGHPVRSRALRAALYTLTQADFVSITDWNEWIPVSATTSAMAIKGAISLDPSPTKYVQFISLDIHPLLVDTGHNVLYDQINRLFSLSSFGTIEESENLDESEKLRRATDKRFKSEGYTNQQLQARKGVDRYPMFFLKIQLKDRKLTRKSKNGFFDEGANIQTVLEVMNVMLTQWLSAHHFRPRKLRSKQKPAQPVTKQKSRTTRSESVDFSSPGRSGIGAPGIVSSPSTLSSRNTKKHKRSTLAQSDTNSEFPRQTPFTEWSRIRSGKADFFQNIWSTKQHTAEDSSTHKHTSPNDGLATSNVEPVLPGKFTENYPRAGLDQHSAGETLTPVDSVRDDAKPDETIEWYDAATRQTYLLNSRTGCVITEATGILEGEGSLPTRTKSMRLQRRPDSDSSLQGPFLSGVLNTWENPVFKPSQAQIKRVSMGDRCSDTHNHARIDLDQAFKESSMHTNNKLSKDGLGRAHIISQVDKKFILVRLAKNDQEDSELLVLIDQHAADERIRVEALLAELCTPLADSRHKNYRSRLGHSSRVPFTILDKHIRFSISSQEHDIFFKYAALFGSWGILYDLVGHGAAIQPGETPNRILVIITLPIVISERCKSDPKLLVNFLRSAVWKYTERPHLASTPPELPTPEQEKSNDTPPWVREISTCPAGLVDIVNSRACRSAIMFNDELSLQECRELVAQLSGCIFPFMCAHGRPSMVPLVDLGTPEDNAGIGFGDAKDKDREDDKTEPFVEAWKAWQAR